MATADILFLTSGTYPYYTGGVSNWANTLLSSLPEYDFEIVSVISNPHVECRYAIPSNVKHLEMLPLWGVIRPEEFSKISARRLLTKMYNTKVRGIEDFLQFFESFLREVVSGGERCVALAGSIIGMYEFLRHNDYRSVVRSRRFWDVFSSFIENEKEFSQMSLFEAIETCRTLGRYLEVLTVDLPTCSLVHSSIAGTIGFLGIIAKVRNNVPFVLTEHGVYYRERLLDLAGRYGKERKSFWVRFETAVAKLNYHFADLIAPVSKFNAQWETELGAERNKIEVIYNGVDTEKFRPMPVDRISNDPTITVVTRVDRLKGILDLVAAMVTVRRVVPDAKCLVFGSASDMDYAQLCMETRDAFGLTDSVHFMGFTSETPAAFNQGDVVTLPSISEGFPFALIEGMACGKATVATDVGGVGEALADTGIVVPPRDPSMLGEALAHLLEDSLHAKKLGVAARDRTISEYPVSKFANEYRRVYQTTSMT